MAEKLASGGGQTHISYIPDEHLNQVDHLGLFSVNVLNPNTIGQMTFTTTLTIFQAP